MTRNKNPFLGYEGQAGTLTLLMRQIAHTHSCRKPVSLPFAGISHPHSTYNFSLFACFIRFRTLRLEKKCCPGGGCGRPVVFLASGQAHSVNELGHSICCGTYRRDDYGCSGGISFISSFL